MNKIFGKVFSSIVFSLLVLIGLTNSTAFAQNNLFFGQDHFYTVIFRGNGEAITYAKMSVTNSEEKPLTEFSFEIPKVIPTEIVMYQLKTQPDCIVYDEGDPAFPCLRYDESEVYLEDYYYNPYNFGKTEYQKIQYTKSDNLYNLTLPTPIKSYESTTIIVAYAAKGYVSKNFGLHKFNFETIKVPSRIENITVAVDVDSDLFLKGKRSSVDYGTFDLSEAKIASPQSISNSDLDNLVYSIGSYGPLMKSAKNLAPNESFIVKGEYSTNWFRLYLNSILLTILIIVAIIVGVNLLTKFLKHRLKSQAAEDSTGMSILTNTSIGLLSAVLTVGLTYLLSFVNRYGLLYQFNYINSVFYIIVYITIILFYILIIFGPSAIVSIKKHSLKSFVTILAMEFSWFVIFLILYFTLFQLE